MYYISNKMRVRLRQVTSQLSTEIFICLIRKSSFEISEVKLHKRIKGEGWGEISKCIVLKAVAQFLNKLYNNIIRKEFFLLRDGPTALGK